MRTRRFFCGVLALGTVFACAAALWPQDAVPVPAQPPPQNVILISWDGMDRSVVKELLEAGKLPNLAALVKEGSLRDIEVTGHETETAPGHAQMLTGLGPDVTGVHSNGNYRPIPEGLTIFERVQKQLGGPEAVRTIMATSKEGYMGGGKAAPYALVRKRLTAFDSEPRPAGEMGPACLDLLLKHNAPRFLAFFHFRDPDRAGHLFGIDSAQYRRAAGECDAWLGRIAAWLKERKLYDRTLVYVTADHGFDPHGYDHTNAPHVWLATNDARVTRGGIQADVPATILARFGLDLAKLEPKLIGTDLALPAKSPAKQPEPVGAVR